MLDFDEIFSPLSAVTNKQQFCNLIVPEIRLISLDHILYKNKYLHAGVEFCKVTCESK